MISFAEYLAEAKEGKNLHLEHLEDIIFDGGVVGTRNAINFIQGLRDALAGHSKSPINITTKWDGAPAIFAGINPENGKFFVATKSAFNKNAKLNYTNADIDKNHPNEGLNVKLKIALRYLPELGITGVYQGDMMFTHEDLRHVSIDGQDYITFQPNTIMYAIPEYSGLAKQIRSAKMGVVWHTQYNGPTMEAMKASFNAKVHNFRPSNNVWFKDASYVDVSGTATFTLDETKHITAILSNVGKLFQSISPRTLNEIAGSTTYRTLIKTFNNTKVREGQKIEHTNEHVRGLLQFVANRYNKEIDALKKEASRQKKDAEKSSVMRWFRTNAGQFKLIFDLHNLLIDAKLMVIRKLEKGEQTTHAFVKSGDEYKVTKPEGFVCVDHIGNAVKLVDRLSFSHHNFNVQKTWTK